MNKCVECANFNLKEIPEMASLGFGWCPKQNPIYANGSISREKTVSASRETCEQFEPVLPVTASNRIEWLSRQKVIR